MDETFRRIWEDLVGRWGGPLSFRLLLQPAMAMLLAIRDGLKDAREGRRRTRPGELLREGWAAVARVFVVAIVIDAIYQLYVFRWFYPGEALIVAAALALLPYLVIRGPVDRAARLWRRRAARSAHAR